MRFARHLVLAACLLAAAGAYAQDNFHSTTDSDAILPNSPYKECDMPDAGDFNPVGSACDGCCTPQPECSCCGCNTYYAPAAITYAPARVTQARVWRRREPALLAAPTLPCAPGYCPMRRPRRDRG